MRVVKVRNHVKGTRYRFVPNRRTHDPFARFLKKKAELNATQEDSKKAPDVSFQPENESEMTSDDAKVEKDKTSSSNQLAYEKFIQLTENNRRYRLTKEKVQNVDKFHGWCQ